MRNKQLTLPNGEVIITRTQVAQMLGVDVRKVSDLGAQGVIKQYHSTPSAKHAYGYFKSTVDEYIRSQHSCDERKPVQQVFKFAQFDMPKAEALAAFAKAHGVSVTITFCPVYDGGNK